MHHVSQAIPQVRALENHLLLPFEAVLRKKKNIRLLHKHMHGIHAEVLQTAAQQTTNHLDRIDSPNDEGKEIAQEKNGFQPFHLFPSEYTIFTGH